MRQVNEYRLAERIRAGVLSVLGLIGALLGLGLLIDSVAVAPKHAIVLVDYETRVYLAPPCIDAWAARAPTEAEKIARPYRLESLPLGPAQEAGFTPEPRCRDQGGFTQEMRSLTGKLFERVGVLKPVKGRWNEDGSWNW